MVFTIVLGQKKRHFNIDKSRNLCKFYKNENNVRKKFRPQLILGQN